MSEAKKIIQDPLSEVTDNPFKFLGLFHHSPSQNMEDGPWFFRYINCDSSDRSKFDTNANMKAGIATGDAIQDHLCDYVWRYNRLTKAFVKIANEKLTKEQSLEKAIEKFKNHTPVNETDQLKKDHFLETIPATVAQGFKAIESIDIDRNKEIVGEEEITSQDNNLFMPTIGRADLMFHEKVGKISRLCVLELKSSWQTPGKIKKDGNRSWKKSSLPSAPADKFAHILQLSFYCFVKKFANPYLLYVTEDDHRLFTAADHVDLQSPRIEFFYNQLIKVFKRHERLANRYLHLQDKQKIIQELALDIDPRWDHRFYWNIGDEYLSKAKQLWNQ